MTIERKWAKDMYNNESTTKSRFDSSSKKTDDRESDQFKQLSNGKHPHQNLTARNDTSSLFDNTYSCTGFLQTLF